MQDLFGGRRWIRTIEAESNRFTVCPLWPLGNSPIKIQPTIVDRIWSWWTDSNPRPADYKSAALPTELHQHLNNACLLYHTFLCLSSTFLDFFQFLYSFSNTQNNRNLNNISCIKQEIWSRRQDLNLRHLGPKPSTLPN